MTHDRWHRVSIALDLRAGNLSLAVSDRARRSAHVPDAVSAAALAEFFSARDRTATVYLGGEYC